MELKSWVPQAGLLVYYREKFVHDWMSEDGLGLLRKGADREPYDPEWTKLRTAGNDNGIQESVVFYLLVHKFGGHQNQRILSRHRILFHSSVELLQARHHKGLYNRNPGRWKDREALDNYCAIATGSALFRLEFAGEMIDYGSRNGFIYDNVNPGSSDDLTRWRQGADVAHYRIADELKPSLWELAWLCGGILFNAFQRVTDRKGRLRLKTSDHIMTWMRLSTVQIIFDRAKQTGNIKGPSPWMFALIGLCGLFWYWILLRKTKGAGMQAILSVYYGGRNPENPIVTLCRGRKF